MVRRDVTERVVVTAHSSDAILRAGLCSLVRSHSNLSVVAFRADRKEHPARGHDSAAPSQPCARCRLRHAHGRDLLTGRRWRSSLLSRYPSWPVRPGPANSRATQFDMRINVAERPAPGAAGQRRPCPPGSCPFLRPDCLERRSWRPWRARPPVRKSWRRPGRTRWRCPAFGGESRGKGPAQQALRRVAYSVKGSLALAEVGAVIVGRPG
jgi:hypothetical protein